MSTKILSSLDSDPQGQRLPIKLDSTSNGEFAPVPLDASLRHANTLASEWAQRFARRLNQSRRNFLVSACGAASTLLAFNAAHARAGRNGGFFEVSQEAALEPQLAAARARQEGIHLRRAGPLREPDRRVDARAAGRGEAARRNAERAVRAGARRRATAAICKCLSGDEFVKDVFLDSDTDIMVLSFVPSTREGEPLTIEEALATRDIVEKMEGTKRLHAARPRQSEPEGRRRRHGAARQARRRRVQDLHAVGPGRQGLLHDRRRRHRIRRARAQGRRAQHLHPQGPAVRSEELRAFDFARHRPDRQALPGRQLPHLSLGLRHR